MLHRILKAADLLAASAGPAPRWPRLVTLAFHGVQRSADDLGKDLVDPFQPLTLQDLDDLLGRLVRERAVFVDSAMLDEGLPADRLAVWLTFDDGYANNLMLPPLLARHGARATIFVATDPVARNRSYWWDVLYRESRKRGLAYGDIVRRRSTLMRSTPTDIEKALLVDFGEAAFAPIGDIDRPMTPVELREMAAEPTIEIGNHTDKHPLLTILDRAEMSAEIAACQRRLETWTGQSPRTIAYPSGDFDRRVVEAAKLAGLRYGVTCLPCAERNPMAEHRRLALGRHAGFAHGRMDREFSVMQSPLEATGAAAKRTRRRILSTR